LVAAATVGPNLQFFNPIAGGAQSLGECRVWRRRPNREDAAGPQCGARFAQSVVIVEIIVRFAHQAFRPIVDIHQDRVIAGLYVVDQTADIALENRDAPIGKTAIMERCKRPPRPGDHFRHKLGDGDLRLRTKRGQSFAQGKAHPQTADQDMRVRPFAQPLTGQGGERLLRSAETAAHQFG
jgi:hypothetical protein